MSALDEARAAANAGDVATVLGALLRAWRETRATAVAEAIARASGILVARTPPVAGKTQKAAFEAWMAVAEKRDPATLGLLLPDLFEGQRPRVRARLAALEAFEPDPRLGALVVERVLTRWFEDNDNPVGTALFKLLATHGERAAIDRLRDWSTANDDRARRLARVEAAVAKLPHRALSPAEETALATIVDDLTSKGASLLSAATDATARLVAADALQEAGDPRGELIMLEHARRDRPLTETEAARAKQIVKMHARAWLGRLGPVLDAASARFEEGLLVSARLTTARLDELLEAPEWGTMRAIDLGPLASPLPLLRRWPNLVEVTTADVEALAAIGAASPPLEIVALGYVEANLTDPDDEDAARARAVLAAMEGTPQLRALEVEGIMTSPERLAFLSTGPLGERLERLRVRRHKETLAEWLRILDEAPPPLRAIELTEGWTVTIERTGHGVADTLRVVFTDDASGTFLANLTKRLVKALDVLPTGRFSHVELRLEGCPAKLRPPVIAVLERLRAR